MENLSRMISESAIRGAVSPWVAPGRTALMCVHSGPHQHRYSNGRGDSGEIFLLRKPNTKHKLDVHRHPPLSKSA